MANLKVQVDMSQGTPLPEEPDRACTRCGVVKPAICFYTRGVGAPRVRKCSQCVSETRPSRPNRLRKDKPPSPEKKRRNRLKSDFGITPEQYDLMLIEQGGRCAVCGGPPSGRRLAVDHCHETGKVRGLLCGQCNLTLGRFEVLRRRFAPYLDQYGEGNPLLRNNSK